MKGDMSLISGVILNSPMPSLSLASALLLIAISLIGGIGITAIGPGGVLVTIALFALTDLSPAEVAGTAIVTHIGTGIVGTLAYGRSGQLREPGTRRLALVLSIVAVTGTPIGVWINTRVSSRQFGIMLAILIVAVGLSIILRDRQGLPATDKQPEGPAGVLPQAGIGGVVAVASGLFGIGGPMISVPIMVIAGFPMLSALAAAQVQSIVVASSGALTYFSHGAISWPLVFLTGIPELFGVWLGWKVAHSVPTRPLKYALAATLILLGPVLIVNR
ncbi:MAG TPA: sulfite exporter TauE/SafE family protein [Thermomicrobiales bacterium]|nr:sulfite exporter TauE/SafE family protein [Thermomicrobiales bacterium]